MSYKVVRKSEATPYEVAAHFEMLPTRLHLPQDVNEGRMSMGLSHFLPGGGAEFGNNPNETIYYVISGQMTLKTDDEETILYAGDTFHCGPGTNKSILNSGKECSKMLVCMVPPKA